MSDYNIKFDTKEFDRTVSRIIRRFPDAITRILKRLSMETVRKVKQFTPVDTGLLKRSWSSKLNRNSAEIFNNVKYGNYVEKGHMSKGGKNIAGRFMLRRAFNHIDEFGGNIVKEEVKRLIK